jgi:hypothetical protein
MGLSDVMVTHVPLARRELMALVVLLVNRFARGRLLSKPPSWTLIWKRVAQFIFKNGVRTSHIPDYVQELTPERPPCQPLNRYGESGISIMIVLCQKELNECGTKAVRNLKLSGKETEGHITPPCLMRLFRTQLDGQKYSIQRYLVVCPKPGYGAIYFIYPVQIPCSVPAIHQNSIYDTSHSTFADCSSVEAWVCLKGGIHSETSPRHL